MVLKSRRSQMVWNFSSSFFYENSLDPLLIALCYFRVEWSHTLWGFLSICSNVLYSSLCPCNSIENAMNAHYFLCTKLHKMFSLLMPLITFICRMRSTCCCRTTSRPSREVPEAPMTPQNSKTMRRTMKMRSSMNPKKNGPRQVDPTLQLHLIS